MPAVRGALRRAAPALGLFAAARLTGMLAVALWAWHLGKNPLTLLGHSWDSRWYTGIAAHGYGQTTLTYGDGTIQSDLAFFPLYPGLVRAVTTVLPVSGSAAGLLVSWAGAAAAAWAIYLIGERLYGRPTAVVLVLLWGLLPHSVVLTMAYTEPVLTAFAAWSLYAVLSGRWLWAGTLAALAGLARPNGIAVAAAVCAAATYELWKRRGRMPWRIWAGAALAPLGWAGFVLWVGAREGDPLGGYFAVQAGWTSRFDFGVGSLRFVHELLRGPENLPFPMVLMIVAASLVLFALLALDRPPLPLLVYTGVLMLITVGGSGYFESKARFLLPAFPLLLPLAHALTKARPRAAIVVTAALAGLSLCYGTYLVTMAPVPV
ncbi:hypothetical protein [Streptomyces sp. H27-C3]|uniref:hypothetical protein n=1 Tax=Streptomyces sp. H27-C3 TaxID=3046305 RepID=UPI0024BB3214|nr:hypothetical protein [Streptomyces sp. H27-C3]MDJ0466777.1 hypothetical protein [Streptomyces sp. H27-C3]